MVVRFVLLGMFALGFALSACGGPSCIRNTDCPQGQRCVASVCQGPGAGTGGVSGSSAGASGSAVAAGTGGTAGEAAGTGGTGGDATGP